MNEPGVNETYFDARLELPSYFLLPHLILLLDGHGARLFLPLLPVRGRSGSFLLAHAARLLARLADKRLIVGGEPAQFFLQPDARFPRPSVVMARDDLREMLLHAGQGRLQR